MINTAETSALSWVDPNDLVMADNAGAVRWHYEAQTEPHEPAFEVYKYFPGEEEVFLDVGANIGNSVVSFRLFNKKARIFSLEPLEVLRPAMDAVKEIEGDRFDFRMAAAGSAAAVQTLYVPSSDNHPVFYLSSFDPDRFGPAPERIAGMRELMRRPLTERYGVTRMIVNVITIDSLGLAPTLVKIDSEGHEPKVLAGMEKTIDRARPLFLIEGGNENAEVADFMRRRDYRFAVFAEGAMKRTEDPFNDGFYVANEKQERYRALGALR